MKKLAIAYLCAVLGLLVFAGLAAADDGDVIPGDLVINEIMYNPATDEPETEWFEVYNNSGAEIDLDGCVFSENGGDSFTITIGSDTTIAASDYFVFGHTSSSDYTVDYEYGEGSGAFFPLNNTTASGESFCDVITITCPNTSGEQVVIDIVAYDDASPWPSDSSGDASISFGIPNGSSGDYTSDNDNGANWGRSTSQIGSTANYGTPGARNDDVLAANVVTLGKITATPAFSVAAVTLVTLTAGAGLAIVASRRKRP